MNQPKVVIMAGGLGKRLWPISEAVYPKPFIRLTGGYSLLQDTLLRNKVFGRPIVIVQKEHRSIAMDQIKEVGVEATLVLEPEGKSTAPCGLIAAMIAKEEGAGQVVLLPADHHIIYEDKYLEVINQSLNYTENSIGTIGNLPSSPHSGYGYIKTDKKLSTWVYEISDFIEKPSRQMAEEMISRGGYYWNSGIYIYDGAYLLEQAEDLEPEMFQSAQESLLLAKREQDYIELDTAYSKITPSSFDIAFMERVKNRVMLEGDFGWYDIGSWDTLWKISPKDNNHNFVDNNVILKEVSNSYIKSDEKLTTVIGLDNVVIINNEKGLLVANKDMLEKLNSLNIDSKRDNLYAAEESANFDYENPDLLVK